MGTDLYVRLGETAGTLRQAAHRRLVAERDRWPLWLPVAVGAGIAVYFALPAEPPSWTGAVVFAAALGLALAGRRTPLLVPAMAVGLAALGFAAASWRTAEVAAPVLQRPSGAVNLAGTVAQVEPRPAGGRRVTLDDVRFDDGALDGPAPTRVRLTFKPALPAVEVGQRIRVRALLVPPARPVAPGSYDFARKAWFMGLGATGTALGGVEMLTDGPPPTAVERVRLVLNGLRQRITARIQAVLPGWEGGVAAAIVTGQTAGIPEKVLADFRNSGLAHILVIAGLHMGMVAGLVFFAVRGGLALVPPIALRWPIKKWAAAAALAVIGFYAVLAGMPVPATRAFLMAALVLVAVLFDRPVLTMRLWALAAAAVLLAEPEQLAGPSFQMSFAAVATLVATYEAAGPWLAGLRGRYPGRLAGIAHRVGRMALTSVAAGAATTVYGLYHFNRIALWQVAANLLAVPLTGTAVMPFAIASLALMPFGAEAWALVPMGWGIRAVGWVAAWVSSWPSAVLAAPVLPAWGLALFSLGGLWLCLWRGRWRLWGLPAMALGLAGMALDRPPDLLVDGRGQSFAVRMADGSLLISKGGRIQRDTWGRRAGPVSAEWWPKQGRSGDGRLSCDSQGCLYRLGGREVALVFDESGLDAACAGPAVVVSAVPIRGACRGAGTVIDRFDLWRRGAHALWLETDGRVRVESAADSQGDRPWSFHPRRRTRRPGTAAASAPTHSEGAPTF
ncbi:MAG: ComEC/Rec2 family competence protein [Magnetospirillum sp.]|nr:ComEC/Rec2 family competence protein [Magnetospirillum sp.]